MNNIESCCICGKACDSKCTNCNKSVCNDHIFRKDSSLWIICQDCNNMLWLMYGKLPEALKDALFSSELTDTIYDICESKGIASHIIGAIVGYLGLVFIGSKSPIDIQRILETEAKLKSNEANLLTKELISLFSYFQNENI